MEKEQIVNMGYPEALQLVKDIIAEKRFSPGELGPYCTREALEARRHEVADLIKAVNTMWNLIRGNLGDTEGERWLVENINSDTLDLCDIILHYFKVCTVELTKTIQICVPHTYDDDNIQDYVTDSLGSGLSNEFEWEICEDCCDLTADEIKEKYRYLDNSPGDFESEDWDV